MGTPDRQFARNNRILDAFISGSLFSVHTVNIVGTIPVSHYTADEKIYAYAQCETFQMTVAPENLKQLNNTDKKENNTVCNTSFR